MYQYRRRNPRTLLEAKAKKLHNELRVPGACIKKDFSEIELELAIAMLRKINARKRLTSNMFPLFTKCRDKLSTIRLLTSSSKVPARTVKVYRGGRKYFNVWTTEELEEYRGVTEDTEQTLTSKCRVK